MTTSPIAHLPKPGLSRLVAAEVRAEVARQGISQRKLAVLMGRDQAWLSRRIGVTADVDLTLEEVAEMAKALNVPVQGLLALPRLDSNQQPSGYQPSQVTDLAAYRAGRAA